MKHREPTVLGDVGLKIDKAGEKVHVDVQLDRLLNFMRTQGLEEMAENLSNEVGKHEFSPERWKDLTQVYGQLVLMYWGLHKERDPSQSPELVDGPSYNPHGSTFRFTMGYRERG